MIMPDVHVGRGIVRFWAAACGIAASGAFAALMRDAVFRALGDVVTE